MSLILCGGGSGEQNTLANSKLNTLLDNTKKILYVPLAMSEEEHPHYDDCYEWINIELSKVENAGIDIVRTFEELNSKTVEDYGALFIGGGNTYRLLKGLKSSDSFEKLEKYIKNDGIVIGGSAGAVIFGKDINVVSSMDKNEVKLEDTKGFDKIFGMSLFPHYTNTKSNFTKEENDRIHQKYTDSIIEYSKKVGKVIAIPEEDAIVVDNGNMEVIGTKPYYICDTGILKKYEI